MKFTLSNRIGAFQWMRVCLLAMALAIPTLAQTVSTTTVQGTVYLANGQPGSGTLQISWPAFTTAANQAVAAGRTTISIGADGFVSVNLAPNEGATPAGLFYNAVFYMSDGTTSTEYWVVPAAAQATIAEVRAQVMPAAQALQTASKTYVDQAIQTAQQSNLTTSGGTLTGPLYLSGDPTQSLQAADKHYVDITVGQSGTVPSTISASVNGVINVAAAPYNATGDCVTDDHDAIQAALTAAVASTPYKTVYFPVPSTAGGCYLTSTLTWTGAPMDGPARTDNPVTIKSEPGQDILHWPDPNDGGVGPVNKRWHIRHLKFLLDDSVAGSFPHRWPGKWANDGAMTSGSAVLTSPHSEFTCSDVGQNVKVAGAGASGADLVTTVASVPNCWNHSASNTATLAAAASTTVSGALVYTSVLGLSTSYTLGAAALAMDNRDANSADWTMTGSYGNYGDILDDVSIGTTSGSLYGQNGTVGFYCQAAWCPYSAHVSDLYISNTQFGVVQGGPDTNPGGDIVTGQDQQVWKHGNITAEYPLIWYNGQFETWEDFQFNSEAGGQILQVYASGGETRPAVWTVKLPENSGNFSTTGQGWRVQGTGMLFDGFSACAGSGFTAYIDTDNSKYSDFGCYAPTSTTLTLLGANNSIEANAANLTVTTLTNDGANNSLTYVNQAVPYQSHQPTVPISMTHARGPFFASGAATPDFLRKGITAAPYWGDASLFFWPEDFAPNSAPDIVSDSTSLTGSYFPISGFAAIDRFANTANSTTGGQITIGGSQAGQYVATGKITAYIGAKCPSITSFTFYVYAGTTAVGSGTANCSTSYSITAVTADLSSYSGQNLIFKISTGEVDIEFIAVVPYTQALHLAADPTTADEAATKNYVDAHTGTPGVYNFTANGGVADEQIVTDGAITSGTTALTSATGSFASGDVGKSIVVDGAGTSGADLTTTIAAYVSATAVTLTDAASTTVSGATVAWGTDNTSALNTLITTVNTAGGGSIYFYGPKPFLFLGRINFTNATIHGTRLYGAMASANGQWSTLPDSPSTLDLRYIPTQTLSGQPSDGKIYASGVGVLEIDHLMLEDKGTDLPDCHTSNGHVLQFIFASNTTTHVHDNAFSGSFATQDACQGGIQYGTAGQTDFQGYGSYFNHNFFDKMAQVFYGASSYADALEVKGNTVSATCGGTQGGSGTNRVSVGAVFNDRGGYGGDVIADNVVEATGYYSALHPINALFESDNGGNTFRGNSDWDENVSGGTHAYYMAKDTDTVDVGLSDVCLAGNQCQEILSTSSHVPSLTWPALLGAFTSTTSGSVSGTYKWAQPITTPTHIQTVIYFSNYQSTAKTINLQIPYQTVTVVGANCPSGLTVGTGTIGSTSSPSQVSVPDNTGTSAFTGYCVIDGQ